MAHKTFSAAIVRPHLPRLVRFANDCATATWAKLHKQHGPRIGAIPAVELSMRLKSTAGWAYYEQNRIVLSAGLLMEFPDGFRKQTIPHELIHMVDFRVNGAQGHGPTWKALMLQYGIPADRCHDYMDHQLNKTLGGIK